VFNLLISVTIFLSFLFFFTASLSDSVNLQPIQLSFSVILDSGEEKRNILGYKVLWFHIFYMYMLGVHA